MAKIKFVKSKSLADAKTASASESSSDSSEIGIYFPPGSSEDTIVMGGKEYGKSVTAVENHYAPSADSASQLSVDASGGTATSSGATTQVVTGVNIQRDAKGHVTGVTVDSKGIKDTTYSAATTSANGLMSSSDKTKLDGIATGAEVNQNALAKITVGSTTLTSTAKQGNLTIANGTGISLALDTTNSKLTITNTVTNSDTKNTTGTTNKTATKLFLAGATEQGSNPVTYSNSNVYIGTDNCLYSGGAKVLTSHQSISGKSDTTHTHSVKINGATKTIAATGGTAVDLGTYLTSHASGIGKIKVGDTTLSSSTSNDTVTVEGSNIGAALDTTNKKLTLSLTKANVTSALGYTPPTEVPNELPNPETLTIQVDGTDLTSYSGAYSDTVNLKAGSNVTLSTSTDTSTGANTITINSSYSTTATKLGTSTVGGAAKPIYLNAGTATACSSTVGSGLKPVYMSSGTITASTSTKGSTTKPVFLSSGTITEGSTYAGGTAVTLNGSGKGGSTASFYAPTTAGTNGYFLTSNGSGAPGWTDLFNTYTIEQVKGYQQATITSTGKTQGLYVECETTYINTIQGFTLSGFWSHTGSSVTPEYGKEYKLIVFNYTTSTNTLTINGTFGLSSHTVIYNGVTTSGSAKTVSMGAYTYHKFTINVLPDSKTGTTYIFIDKDLSWQ